MDLSTLHSEMHSCGLRELHLRKVLKITSPSTPANQLTTLTDSFLGVTRTDAECVRPFSCMLHLHTSFSNDALHKVCECHDAHKYRSHRHLFILGNNSTSTTICICVSHHMNFFGSYLELLTLQLNSKHSSGSYLHLRHDLPGQIQND